MFSRNSLTTPNDVFLLDPAVKEERKLTDFSSGALEGKSLSDGEEVWWEGAEGRKVQGWIVKPPGFKKGEEKKWRECFLFCLEEGCSLIVRPV